MKSHYRYRKRKIMKKKTEMNFDDWLAYGIDNKWCHLPLCSAVDVLPMTIDEELEEELGYEPSIYLTRFYDTPEQWAEGEAYIKSNQNPRSIFQIE